MRTINPLESSMAAESVFIYPNGREVPRNAMRNALTPQAHAASSLPFKSLVISEGGSLGVAGMTSPGALGGGGGGGPLSPGALGGSSSLLSPGAQGNMSFSKVGSGSFEG